MLFDLRPIAEGRDTVLSTLGRPTVARVNS